MKTTTMIRSAVAQWTELERERVGDSRLKPADATGRPSGQDRPAAVRAAKRSFHAVHAPDREHVRGVPAADHDDILRTDEPVDVVDGAVE